MPDLTSRAEEYLRSLNGEPIPMSFVDAQIAAKELRETGFILTKGYINGLTPAGRAVAKKLKREATGKIPPHIGG